MNYTSLEDAYKIHHTNQNVYKQEIKYSPTCIYCSNSASKQLMNDGGSFRQCERCKKNFRANVLCEPVKNYSLSTQHLQGTN